MMIRRYLEFIHSFTAVKISNFVQLLAKIQFHPAQILQKTDEYGTQILSVEDHMLATETTEQRNWCRIWLKGLKLGAYQ
jgi:uncharacterized protein YecA (UPF0149 family)